MRGRVLLLDGSTDLVLATNNHSFSITGKERRSDWVYVDNTGDSTGEVLTVPPGLLFHTFFSFGL